MMMLFLIYLFNLFLLFYPLSLKTQQTLTSPSLEETTQVKLLASTLQAFSTPQHEAIWPGFQLNFLPTIIHFKNGHLYAFHFKGDLQLWKPHMIGDQSVLFCGAYSSSLSPIKLHPNFLIENQRAFIFSMDHEMENANFSLLTFIHERFHLYQFKHFVKMGEEKGAYQGNYKEENLALMEIENQLLTGFLVEAHSNRKREYLKDYLAVTAKRQALMDFDSWNCEMHQQHMEGLADYVSLKTYQVFPLIPDYHPEKVLLRMREKKTTGLSSISQDAIKGRHYFVGATLGFALDFCAVPNWKLQIQQGSASLHALLTQALPLSDLEKKERLARLQGETWMSIRKKIDQKLQEEKKQFEALLETFHHQGGIAICVGLPKQSTSGGGRYQGINHFDYMTLTVGETSCATSQDQKWKLCFDNMPFIFEHKSGKRTFKLNKTVTFHLDGKEIAIKDILASSYPFSFHSLIWKDVFGELICSLPGYLYTNEGMIYIEFE